MAHAIELLNANIDEEPVFTPRLLPSFPLKRVQNGFAPFPKYCILGFFPGLFQAIRRSLDTRRIGGMQPMHPYLVLEQGDFSVGYVYAGIGSAWSSAILEETFALGSQACIFLGSAGGMNPDLFLNDILLPIRAVRDEGTSFHYLKPGRYTHPDPDLAGMLRSVLADRRFEFKEGTVWSTDGVYRETPSKISRLRDEGCLAVDMEASALFAVGAHLRKRVAGLFMALDDLRGEAWKPRLPKRTAAGKKQTDPMALFRLSLLAFELLNRVNRATSAQ